MLQTIEHAGIVELRLDRPPVNAMNLELVDSLISAHANAVKKGAQVIVISGNEKVFSAGLDVPEQLRQSRNGMTVFWDRFFTLMQQVLLSKVPVVAALTGHAPAGGAVLAIHCDYRIATAGEFRIGLNEVQVGLPVPPSIQRVLRSVVGARQAGLLASRGLMLAPGEALQIGLVDEVVPSGTAVERAIAYGRELAALPPTALNTTRLAARTRLKSGGDDIRVITDYWFSAETQATLRKLVAQLGKQ